MTTKRFVRGNSGIVNVTFDLPAAVQAEEIALCGDFNHWSHTETRLRRGRNRVWKVTIPLQAGHSYRYRYLLDGSHWENDWSADAYVPNVYGSEDSLLNIPAERQRPIRSEPREESTAMQPAPETAAVAEAKRQRHTHRDSVHEQAPGVQRANVGYWQAVGSTRAAAKRSKRP